MTRIATTIVWLMLAATPASAQLEVQAGQRWKVSGVAGATAIGDQLFFDSAVDVKTIPVGIVRVDSEAANVEVTVTDINRVPIVVEQLTPSIYMIAQSGKFWADVTAIDFLKNIYRRKTVVVEVGPPQPVPPPVPPTPVPPEPVPPEPEPVPPPQPAPIDGDGMAIMLVYESADASKLSPGHQGILFSAESRSFLKSAAGDNWRLFDKDTEFTDANNKWAKALKRDRGALPWVVISNGTTGFEGPLPNNLAEFRGMVEIYRPATSKPVPAKLDPLPMVIKYSTANCIWCDKWDAEVAPYLTDCQLRETSSVRVRVYPSFKIIVGNRERDLFGYQSAATIQSTINQLRAGR